MSALAVALAALSLTSLHDGQRRWYAPGELRAGARVVCIARGHRLAVQVPRGGTGRDLWVHGVQASVSVHSNGAAEFDCNVPSAPPRIPAGARYLVSRNGLGLLRGPNTRARLERLYGRGIVTGCAVAWPSIGLRASFAGCAQSAVLVGATVTGRRWSTLDGVHVGDSLARLRWQDAAARRVGGAWLLGGVGLHRTPRLVALVGARGRVTGFRIVSR